MSLETAENIKITSQIINYPNRQGRNITAFYDYIDRQPQNNNLIIIPPAYGETKKDSLKISYFLVRNGFNCIRYDSTDHVGESYGDMLDASFEKMKDDLLSTLDFSETELKVSGVGLAGTSLGIRIGIKAASLDNRIKLILGLVPIVDIQSSLRAIYHQDILAEVMEGMYKGKTIDDIMGFEVSIDFALSAIKYKYHNLDTTFDDIKMADIPLVMISAENDPWSDPKSVQAVLEHSPSKNKEFILIPNAMHQLNENPEAAIFAIQQTVIKCKKYLLAQTISPKEVIIPSEDEMSRQWLIEEERLKILLKKDLEGEKAFWEKYLNKFLLINKSRDYRDFLKQVSEMLDIRQAERVLDAGCGNGHFGAWILHELIHKISNDKIPWDKFVAPEYFGLDFVENRIKEGRLKHLNMLRRIYRELCIRERYRIINYRYILADLDARLPFRDNFFD
ncbi:MAG: hypothetical protein KJ926_00810 [Candidatus Omnitrophica bacterium]|nr:hypothetical protein [Candidatus Omnitrophota bacterium]